MALIPLNEWMTAVEEAMGELATTALAFPDDAVKERGHHPPREMCGSYIPIVCAEEAVQIGLVALPASCQALAKSLLAMELESEDLPEADMADAMNEIANIFAGGIKKRLLGRLSSISLGLPMFFHGILQPTEKFQFSVAHINLGPLSAALLVVRQNESR